MKREETESKRDGITWGGVREEVKRVGRIAAPMVAVISSQYLLQMISVMMVGHLGELSLSSTAIAISLAGVSGFSLLVRALLSLALSPYTFSTLCFGLFYRVCNFSCWASDFVIKTLSATTCSHMCCLFPHDQSYALKFAALQLKLILSSRLGLMVSTTPLESGFLL